ncbi:nucleolar MIF4G domain-containing protein 1 homolog [Melitaea cinxia]|uniref:nucleolar MIF4G domain-containing protein 1 homolog n=1 Tax=Melitaea cinxia TaxID=113334 RepID=UPI001E26ECAE|nr:nucleolar MIF4G domain-containing protein 1 homolog [Melitaea cinxia]
MKKVKQNKPKFTNTRKALRKEKRKQKKVHRLEHSLKKKNKTVLKFTPGQFVKRPDDVPVAKSEKKKKMNNQPSAQDILIRQIAKEKRETEKLKTDMDSQRKQILLKANEEEDKMIKKLEKHLGLNKSKNKNNYFSEDGLDYLLEVCDRATSEQIVAAEKHLADVERDSDFEEDLAVVTGKELPKDKKKHVKNKSDEDDDDESNDETGSGDEIDFGDEIGDEEESGDEIDSVDEMEVDEEMDEKIESGESENDDMSENSELDDHQKSPPKKKKANSNLKTRKEKATSKDRKLSVNSDDMSDLDFNKKSKKAKNNKPDFKNAKSKKEKIVCAEDLDKVFSEDEISHLSDDGDTEGFSDNDGNDNIEDDSSYKKAEKPDVWEDIYGRKRDKEGNIIKEEKGVYIPPHLRNKDSTSDKDLALLKRQIKSVLNKLAGTNLHWACTSIENLYSNNSRNSVNTALTQLWLEATVGPTNTPDRMVAEHAALVSVLHANVGSEIGAHFLEELSRKFDEMMETPQPVEDKRLDNLVSCLAHLYCFKIYHASLLYDILARLLHQVSEKSIDCVLTALRSVGGVLRKEEPAALKTFIHDTQAKLAKLHQSAESGSRVKFLLEVLLAVKNNNLNKIPNYDPTYVEELKKACRSVVRRGNYVTPLNIRLEDLLKAHERGKWWVVGSAWEGSRIQEDKPTVKTPSMDQKLLELARQQRMNTDVRRSIFCVIMSAEDYLDAFEKLQHLGLKGQQEREVVHVLLACCLQEKTYNPYYSVLGQKLCDFDRKYQLSIQYSVWDKIKDLESLSKQAMTNLGQFLIHLIMEKGLPLSVLKIIQFSDLNKKSVRFMRQILLAIIMNADLQASLEVFHRISKAPKLHMFRESLRLFIQHFLIKNAGKKTSILSEDEMATLKDRTVEVDKILTMYESKLRL